MNHFVRRAPPAAITLAMVLGLSTLAGCNKPAGQNADALLGNAALGNMAFANGADALPPLPAALPLESGPATVPRLAPSAAALPAAPPVPVARIPDPGQSYAYLDRAYGQFEAYGDAPPDYTFDYEGVNPWVWEAADDSLQFAEPIDGGYRYYYYEPGADYPYLVRDPYYAYAYSGNRLAAVYDDYGRVLDERAAYRRASYAGRYLSRARLLREAAMREQRRRVNAENWAARRAAIVDARRRWERQRQQDAAWRDYSRRNEQRQANYWRTERERRSQEALRFASWQREGFRGPDPVRGDIEAQRRRAQAIRQRQVALAQERRAQMIGAQQQQQQRQERQRAIAEQRDRSVAVRQQAQADRQRQHAEALRERQQAIRQQQLDRAQQAAAARADAQRQNRVEAQQQRLQAQRDQQRRAAEQRRQAQQDRRDEQRQQAAQRQRDARAEAARQRQDTARQQAEARARAAADQRREAAARQQADRQREQARARADAVRERQQAAARDRQEQAQRRAQEARAQAQQRRQEARAQAQQRQREARNRAEAARRQAQQHDRRPQG